MKLLRTYAIIGILQIVLCLTGYAQDKPTVTTAVIGTDTVFVMNREYAELVAERFDSLASLKESFSECNSVVDGLQSAIVERGRLISEQNNLIGNLHADILNREAQIESYQRSVNAYKEVEAQLKKETRKRKVWTIVACVGGAAGLGGVIFGLSR